ncbi:hypothetical protein [Bacillus toyonensis]|uniref:hypothetical protein n=1 Tax=Bacillus toyonensis TaxID=155322 RepID=UPI000BF692A1|nr:hypothetical protein [Bacillus toyonensis]PEO80840.1 hypothetical protein CN570_08340 [Bacillus toyonensis]
MPTIRELSDDNHFITIYLAPVTPEGSSTQQEMHNILGLIEYSEGSSTTDPLIVYRFLGTQKENLYCKSTILISTRLIPKPTTIDCDGETVLFLEVPFDANIPYTDLTFGDSIFEDFETLYGSRRHLTISNKSSIDLWFEWFRDVHTDHAEDFIPHTKHATRKSRKVNTSASFPVKVYKNNAGQRGEYLDSFTADVYGHERVECIVVTIGSNQYLQVISVVEQPLKVLMQYLLA